MSNYTQINDYSAKDALPSGDPAKKITGADIDGTPGVNVFDLLYFLDCWFPASAGTPCP